MPPRPDDSARPYGRCLLRYGSCVLKRLKHPGHAGTAGKPGARPQYWPAPRPLLLKRLPVIRHRQPHPRPVKACPDLARIWPEQSHRPPRALLPTGRRLLPPRFLPERNRINGQSLQPVRPARPVPGQYSQYKNQGRISLRLTAPARSGQAAAIH